MTRAEYAEHIGVSVRRVAKLVSEGMPLRKDRLIDAAKADAWIAQNIDDDRRASAKGTVTEARNAKLTAEAAIANLKAQRVRGELVERAQIELFLKTRAVFERDAWLSIASSKARELAAACGCDVSTAFAILDKIVREQLCELARVPVVLPDAASS
jgi:phage terminase Nu1 subunit (DNA packaging protein)